MRRWSTLVIGLVVLCYAAIVWGVEVSKPKPSTGPAGSSQSVDATGSLAVSRLWGRLGLSFQPWAQVPGLLPDTSDVFVSVSPDGRQYRVRQARDLLQWVRAGHDAVWVTQTMDSVLATEGLAVHPVHTPVRTAYVRRGGQRSTLVIRLAMQRASYLSGPPLAHARVKVDTPQGVIAAEFPIGRGHLWVCSTPAAFFNGTIGQRDNFRLVWLLLGNRGVLWDEYGHGMVAQSLVQTTFSQGRQWSLVWFAAAAAAFIWMAMTRFGRPMQDVSEAERHHGEWLAALAHQLGRPKLRSLRDSLLSDNLERRLGREITAPLGKAAYQTLTRELRRKEREARSGIHVVRHDGPKGDH